MIIWDFIGAAFYVAGAWLSQNWLILCALTVLGGIAGWVCYEWRHAPDVPSQAEK